MLGPVGVLLSQRYVSPFLCASKYMALLQFCISASSFSNESAFLVSNLLSI